MPLSITYTLIKISERENFSYAGSTIREYKDLDVNAGSNPAPSTKKENFKPNSLGVVKIEV